jgi:hypothetical protein
MYVTTTTQTCVFFCLLFELCIIVIIIFFFLNVSPSLLHFLICLHTSTRQQNLPHGQSAVNTSSYARAHAKKKKMRRSCNVKKKRFQIDNDFFLQSGEAKTEQRKERAHAHHHSVGITAREKLTSSKWEYTTTGSQKSFLRFLEPKEKTLVKCGDWV